MPKGKKIDFDAVRRIALGLTDVEESTMYGSPAFKLGGRMLACIPTHKSAEPDSLAVRTGFEQREELIATAPDIYYVKDHYLSSPLVLVRLSRIQLDALRDLLGAGWRIITADAAARKRKIRKQSHSRPR
jgi:hypothetical protein